MANEEDPGAYAGSPQQIGDWSLWLDLPDLTTPSFTRSDRGEGGMEYYQEDNPNYGLTQEQWTQKTLGDLRGRFSDYADYIQAGPTGAIYAPRSVMEYAAQSSSGGGWVHNWLDSIGPLFTLISLGSMAAAGAAAGGATSVAGGPVGAEIGAADALGLQQMALDAGLPAGSTASEAFIASGGTMGSTAAGGLGDAATLAESFGYATPEYIPPNYGGDWWDTAKNILNHLPSFSGGAAAAAPLLPGISQDQEQAPDLGATGATGAPPEAASPLLADVPLPAAPKPGAPDYQSLWQSYSGWIDNVNRINEGAFADVRARLSAAGAAPDLIKMQTEHLESQRVSAVEDFNKSATFSLLQEGYDIAVGGKASPYEGGLGPYAGEGKPALMDFYTELYGQPDRGAGASGKIGTGGTPSVSASTGANPWFEDSGRMSLIG